MGKQKYRASHWLDYARDSDPASFKEVEAESIEKAAVEYWSNVDDLISSTTYTDIYVHDGNCWWSVEVGRIAVMEYRPRPAEKAFSDD